MSVALVVALELFTCGLYTPIWFIQRGRFLNGLDTSESINDGMSIASLTVWVLSFFAVVFSGIMHNPGLMRLAHLANLTGAVVVIIMSFRAREMIEQHMRRIGQHVRLSGLATFFLQVIYLQYHINRIPETSNVARHFD